MKFSEVWMREWVSPELDREALLHQLTMAGLEVDGVEPVAADFTGVVVARVESCERHPDADKLTLCLVNDGEKSYQVICGAPNVRQGLTVALARVGAVLPDNFKIKRAKLRGVESFGMLCSARELGLGDDHDGILELPEAWSVGDSVRDAMALDDVTVDLDLTPNRGDCLSLKGVAREVGVLNNLAVNYPQIHAVPATHEVTFPVTISHPEGCPRYLGRVVSGVDLGLPSPFWMQERLRRCGLRSIDPVVDVTNYVMIELGQPMHAFDLRQINGGIDVRLARTDEKLVLLDGQEVALDTETMLIADADGPVAIAGVMGGQRSGVQSDTQDVFLECAYFAPLAVAGTARRYGLHTDASHRYERGVDYTLQAQAIERATALLLEIVGGEPGPIVDAHSQAHLPIPAEVSLRQQRLHQLLGVPISAQQVDDAFARLDFDVMQRDEAENGVVWRIVAPSHRFDIAIEADLVEEVCRVYGYNNIPSRQPKTALELSTVPLQVQPEAQLKRQMAALGFQEVITYTFIDPMLQDLLDPGLEPVVLANPMSRDQSVMRTNMLAGLVDAARANQSRQQSRVQLFEVGLTFRAEGGELRQVAQLGGLLWGRRHGEDWLHDDTVVDFFDAKGAVDAILAWSGKRDIKFVKATDGVLHPGQSATIWAGEKLIGRVGRLHPELESHLNLPQVFVFEMNLQEVLTNPKRLHSRISRYPSVRRDLAVVIAREISAAELERTVREALGETLVEFRLFDVYEGKGIDSNEKSVALGLTLQSQTATLTEEEIGHYAQQALTALENGLGARLR